jgi:hypothetical protein
VGFLLLLTAVWQDKQGDKTGLTGQAINGMSGDIGSVLFKYVKIKLPAPVT